MNEFTGLKVMLVEDEGGVALLIEDMLRDLGCEVTASIARISEAADVAMKAAIHLAVLDVNVQGRLIFPVAEVLRSRGIPFVFSTGYGKGGLPPVFEGRPVLTKPFTIQALHEAILTALGGRGPPIKPGLFSTRLSES